MVMNHGLIRDMETVPISLFKARCLAILARVKRTGRPILVTRFGEPVAEVVPPTASARPRRWLGSMKGTARIVGDIVAPASAESDWEALRE
jgi:prevent-host-death family protein